MVFPPGIPIDVQTRVTVRGTVWRTVRCEHCEEQYAFPIQLEATGNDVNLLLLDSEGSRQRAQANAEQTLAEQSRNMVVPIPCPGCGSYQAEMVRRMRDDGHGHGLSSVGFVLIVVSLVSANLIAPRLWVLDMIGLLGVLAGAGIVGYGDLTAALFDPNTGNPEPRKALGRKLAVWGEKLAELTAVNATAENTVPVEHKPEHRS